MTGGITYFVYGRLNVLVSASDEEVTNALNEYADRHIKGGRAKLTDDFRAAVLREHQDAWALYVEVMG